MDGRSHTVKGDDSEKESQVRHLGTESTPWFGAGPHQAGECGRAHSPTPDRRVLKWRNMP